MKYHVFKPDSCSIRKALRSTAVVCSLLPLAMVTPGLAEPAGTVKTSKGSASIHRQGQILPVEPGTMVDTGDRVVTGANSAVGIVLRDNTSLTAGPNSQVDLHKFSFNSTTHAGELDASVKRGTLAVISGKVAKANPESVRFATASMTLGVRGTEFVIEAAEGE